MLAVTTRNKLRSPRFFLPMLRARRHVREQLGAAPGLIRYVSAIAGPTEFLTLTVWEDRRALFQFMSSGAHETFLWKFTRWSESFWSMRWLPTTAEEGAWEGLAFADQLRPDDLDCHAAHPQAPHLPLPEPPPATVTGRRSIDPSNSGVYAITALVEPGGPRRLFALPGALRGWRREAGEGRLLRWTLGAVGSGRFFVLTLWQDAPEDLAGMVGALRRRLGACWAMGWTAGEYEIGHWNDLRLRRIAAARLRQPP